MTMESFFSVLVSSVVLFGSAMIYILPLRKRGSWLLWLPVMFGLIFLFMAVSRFSNGSFWMLGQLLQYLCLVLLVNRCTKLSVTGDLYCAIWILVTGETIYELWLSIPALLPDFLGTIPGRAVSLLLFAGLCYVGIALTAARWMPNGDIYQIGPRQLSSALILGGLCMYMSEYFLVPKEIHLGKAMILLLCQIYCISLLYLQTELFKKSKLQKDLETMNLLYAQGAQQYAVARQNIQAVTSKCEALEQLIARMEQYLPEEELKAFRPSMDYALRACDTAVKSGNSVLDLVLTEKMLLAEADRIQLSCVADGKLLNFMEVTDIYALFSNALDNAIQAVRRLPDKDHRIIDLLVHENQNFLVINISNPVKDTVPGEEELPALTKGRSSFRGYGLRVMRHVVEKYHGICTFRAEGGFFTLKALIPLSKNRR